ncbi:MAG: hypothetical protein JY451_09290 [Erythrobacter sp.]|nr:MAG: hypothetical protein JY451_09290 [Erythrobacter sp.]
MADFFWFSDKQWARIEPLLPQDTRGMLRVSPSPEISPLLACGGQLVDALATARE